MNIQNNTHKLDDEINLSDLVRLLVSSKISILTITCLTLLISLLYAFSLPDKYVSSILLVPANDNTNSNLASQYGGLASLAGISLPEGSVNKSDIGIEVLKSKLFITGFLSRHNVIIPMMASESWDKVTKELEIDERLYDVKNKKWVRNVSAPKKSKPSLYEAAEFWKKNIFSISKDNKKGLITIKIEHYSPFEAQRWAELLFKDLNNHLRDIEVEEADLSIQYLNEEANKTESKELKQLFYSLIESQTKTKMLAFSRKDYSFKMIDPPIVPENKSSPNKFRIILQGAIIGIIFGLVFAYIRNRKFITT